MMIRLPMKLLASNYLQLFFPEAWSELELGIESIASLKTILIDQGQPIGEIQLVITNGQTVELDQTQAQDVDCVKIFSPIDGG